eukprot:11633102-Alexandrium_andersonii.AAC.1
MPTSSRRTSPARAAWLSRLAGALGRSAATSTDGPRGWCWATGRPTSPGRGAVAKRTKKELPPCELPAAPPAS